MDGAVVKGTDHATRHVQELSFDLENTCRHVEILLKTMGWSAIHHQGLAELAKVALSCQCASDVDLDLDILVAALLGLLDRFVRLRSLAHTWARSLLDALVEFIAQILLRWRGEAPGRTADECGNGVGRLAIVVATVPRFATWGSSPRSRWR